MALGHVIKHWVKDAGKEVRHQHPPQADHRGSQDSLVPEDQHQSNLSSEQGTQTEEVGIKQGEQLPNEESGDRD